MRIFKTLEKINFDDFDLEYNALFLDKVRESQNIIKQRILCEMKNLTLVVDDSHRNLFQHCNQPVIFGCNISFEDLKQYNQLIDFAIGPDNRPKQLIKTIDDYSISELLTIIQDRLNNSKE